MGDSTPATRDDVTNLHGRLNDVVETQQALALSVERTATILERIERAQCDDAKARGELGKAMADAQQVIIALGGLEGAQKAVKVIDALGGVEGAQTTVARLNLMWMIVRVQAALFSPVIVAGLIWLGSVIAHAIAGAV